MVTVAERLAPDLVHFPLPTRSNQFFTNSEICWWHVMMENIAIREAAAAQVPVDELECPLVSHMYYISHFYFAHSPVVVPF